LQATGESPQEGSVVRNMPTDHGVLRQNGVGVRQRL
jgi:hypothetical protein